MFPKRTMYRKDEVMQVALEMIGWLYSPESRAQWDALNPNKDSYWFYVDVGGRASMIVELALGGVMPVRENLAWDKFAGVGK